MLPVLHLNGYKISGPDRPGPRHADADVRSLLEAHGYEVHLVEGDDPMPMHRAFAATLDTCYARIRAIQADARAGGGRRRPRWPAIVLRSPKGWTGPKVVDGQPVEGTFRAHQVPLPDVQENPEHLKMLEQWMHSYDPERLFDARGRLASESGGTRARGPPTHGGEPSCQRRRGWRRLLWLSPTSLLRGRRSQPATERRESTRQLGDMMRDVFKEPNRRTSVSFAPTRRTRTGWATVFEVENRCSLRPIMPTDDHVAPDGRVMEVLSEHLCQGWLEGYVLTGRARPLRDL